eukprot:6176738-Pleurochrysis_carterae.AAC.1
MRKVSVLSLGYRRNKKEGPREVATGTPELACFTILILHYRETTRATIRAGRKRRKYINTHRRGLGASGGARAGSYLRGGSRRWLYWAAAAIASVFPKA